MNSPNARPTFTATCNNCGCFVQGRSQQCPYCGGSVTRTSPEERQEPSFERREPGFDRKEPVFGEPAAAAVPPSAGPTNERPRGKPATQGHASPFAQSAPDFLATPTGGYGGGAPAAYPVAERRRSGLSAILALGVFAIAFAGMVVVVRQANRAPDDDTASTRSATGELAPQQNPAAPDASQNAPQAQIQAPNAPPPVDAQSTQPAARLPDATTTAGAMSSQAAQPQQQASPSSTVPAAPAITQQTAQQPAQQTVAPAPATQAGTPAPYRHALSRNRTAHPDWNSPSIAAIEAAPAVVPQPPRASGSARPELAAARSDLEESNLEGARAALNRALAQDPSNGQALALQQQLASRERARDAALNIARDCLAHQAWKCAWHNAGNALSIDSSSEEASSIVQRSQVDWGQSNQAAGQDSN